MPFLRVIRDKRGYETTYLMHWYREGNRQRSRILYVFRTPGGARVGRESLEPAVLRELETQHPDITFDWKTVLANRQVIETGSEPRRPRGRKGAGEDAEPTPPAAVPEAKPDVAAPPPSIPATLQGSTPDEQIAFLNHWHGIIRERILQRVSEPARQEALMALAERLNPGNWTDADQIAEGLPRAAEALERLSRVFSRRRRRRRGAGSAPPHGPAVLPSSPDS